MISESDNKIIFHSDDLKSTRLNNRFGCYKKIRNRLQPLLMTFWDFKKLPFLCIKITYKCRFLNNFIPHYQKIHEERKCLPLSVDVDIRTFLAADKDDPLSLQAFFEIATLDCLIHIGKRYQLKIKVFQDRQKTLGKVPKWDLKMKGNSSFFPERKLKIISLSKNFLVTRPNILLEKRKII